jgi:hypothetical protein
VKHRIHLDLRAHDVDAEAGRLVGLGATIAPEQSNDSLIVLHDPEGT